MPQPAKSKKKTPSPLIQQLDEVLSHLQSSPMHSHARICSMIRALKRLEVEQYLRPLPEE